MSPHLAKCPLGAEVPPGEMSTDQHLQESSQAPGWGPMAGVPWLGSGVELGQGQLQQRLQRGDCFSCSWGLFTG